MSLYVYILAILTLGAAVIVGCNDNHVFFNSYHVQTDVVNKERVTAVVK